jgi:hypothetical protein
MFLQSQVRSGRNLAHYEGGRSFENIHMLFTSLPSRPASGLRLETAPNIDKKKPEFYFSSPVKKILTEKAKRHCAAKQKSICATKVDRTP